ncbi:hypothetical protein EVAR_7955_1 [Eumeta japonica]|uniref:Uncharacterized protein n=1 Tax=Eumeta variegata TaxID=151549 RepID=A0A4C1TJY5_EUMVA|nr:hypothetical protein EVAR_7955_1 [Eumeta japonica]
MKYSRSFVRPCTSACARPNVAIGTDCHCHTVPDVSCKRLFYACGKIPERDDGSRNAKDLAGSRYPLSVAPVGYDFGRPRRTWPSIGRNRMHIEHDIRKEITSVIRDDMSDMEGIWCTNEEMVMVAAIVTKPRNEQTKVAVQSNCMFGPVMSGIEPTTAISVSFSNESGGARRRGRPRPRDNAECRFWPLITIALINDNASMPSHSVDYRKINIVSAKSVLISVRLQSGGSARDRGDGKHDRFLAPLAHLRGLLLRVHSECQLVAATARLCRERRTRIATETFDYTTQRGATAARRPPPAAQTARRPPPPKRDYHPIGSRADCPRVLNIP